jgi:putative membrane protein
MASTQNPTFLEGRGQLVTPETAKNSKVSTGEGTIFPQLNSHLANERTQLAYLRTSLALLSFGITLNRFSRALSEKSNDFDHGSLKDTEGVGLGMVLMGIVILIWGLYRYEKNAKGIENGTYTTPRWGMVLLTLAILVIGAAMSVLMILD